MTVNPVFDGEVESNLLAAGTSLAVGESATVTLALTVTPGGNLGPYDNLVVATGESPSGLTLTDDSVDGAIPDANGNGDPGDDTSPTSITFSETPSLGVAKSATVAEPNFDDTFTSTVTVVVENAGDVVLNDVQLDEPLGTNFAPAVVVSVDNLTVNGDIAAVRPGFDGVSETRLLADGQSLIAGGLATITFDVTVNLSVGGQCANIPLSNTVTGSGRSPSGQLLTDLSETGADPDPDGDANPGNNDAPTTIDFAVGVDGVVTVTEELLPGEDIAIQVVDADQNRNSAVADTVTVVIENLTSGESETLTLVETGVDSGVFEATLPTVESNVAGTSDDGQLNLFFLDNFTATYDDTLSSSGCGITVTDAGSATGLATLVGNVWLDTNSDDNFDVGENGLEGWIIELTDSAGNVIATVTVAADGSYTIPDIEPGEDFTITLRHPDTGTIFGQITDVDLPPDTTVIDQNLPVDPSGVFYDAVARQPIPGVDVRLVDANGVPLPAACLLPGQQPQTTAADGFYRFDVLLGADPACQSGDSFFIAYDVPDGYQSGVSELIPPIADPIDPTGLGDPVRVGDTPTTPQGADSTDYYLGFTLEDNDPDVIFNHIPIDPLGVETSSVRLTKRVARPTTTVGSLVVYTITIENLSPVTLPNIEVLDTLPPGFSYVDNSALLDGQQNGFTVSGPRPLVFASIALAPGQLRTLQYALRVGAGVTQGDYINTATPTLNGGPIGNTDQAEVQVIADPDFEETTIIGKVWHDRDADGWQDNADATGIQISGNPFGDGRVLPDLPGRDSEGENIERHQVELVMPFSDAAITVTTAEGSVVTLHKGEMTTAHSGDVEAGRNGQQIEVARERIVTERREVTRAVQQSNTVTLDAVIEPVRFESGKAAIPPDYVERLRTVLEELGDRENLRLSFVGHTDNQRLSARTAAIYADNQGLSESRARTVAEFLQRPLGLPATAIQTSGRGDRRPVASNATPEGMALNRRVEIQVLYDEVSSETLTEVEMIGGEDTGEMRVIVRNVGINEEGIAGVRLATVEGLIIETDSKGRYHIAAVDGGFLERGRNFIVKVDPATLPQGAEFTTENPRVKRITQGLLSQFDFGVLLPRHSVSRAGMRAFEFSPAFFAKGSAEVASEYAGLLENLVAELTAAGGGRVVVLAGDDAADRALATARGRLLREKLRASLPEIVWRNTEVYVLANSTGTPTARRPSTAQRVAGVLLGLFINTAHADEACTILSCNADGEPVVASQYLTTDTMMPSPGQDDTGGRFRIALPGAGVIWATEDAAVLTPRLSVEGPRVLPVGTRAPVVFAAYSNYHAFIDEYVLEIYRESDVDRVSPLARVRPVSVPEAFGGLVYFEWQPQPGDARIDERLAYELTVTGANGLRDQTSPGFTQVLSTQRYAEERDKAAERFAQREDARLLAPNLLTGDLKVPADEALRLLTRTWGRSQLVRQNILLTGARVRLIGDDLSPSHAIYVGGHQVPVDAEGDMAAEYLLPIGEHWAEVAVGSEQDGVWFKDIPVTVTGEHRFMVALADFTATSSDFSGALEPLSGNERFADDSLAEGRLAYYLKAKIKGKYLLTSQLDSREEQLSDILGNLDRKDSRTLFRRLDPDRYYPVYGDDSTTEWDADSLGRFYVRLDWNKSRAVWGNYQTEISDSEFIQYRRSLYGAQLSWNSVATTGRDETRSKLSVFASETQTALGHSEFLGTGGSLYYLRHIDILPGSDQARIEIRDADTNRVIENITLVRGRDYEVDELQGRIILGRPLLQIAEQSAPSIIKRGPLDGNLAILIVDYEYVPAGFDTNQLAAGGRAKQWFGDHLAVGGTYLSEGRGGEDYSLAGIDVTLAAGEGTYLKVEAASSEATQTERLFSTDGGLSFTSLTPANGDNRAGEAVGVESRINLQELGWTEGRTTAAAWWRRIDDQFSIARRDDGVDVVESGVELSSELGERAIVAVRASEVEREGQITDTDLAVQLDYRINDKGSVSAEVRQLTQEQVLLDQEIDATLAALRYAHQFSDVTEIYATGQVTLSNDDGQYDNNDLVSVGVTHQLTGRTALTGEVSSGHRGEGASMTLSHDVNADHTIYGTMTHSTDRTDNPLSTAPGDSASGFNASRLLPGNTLAIGHRSRISNQLDVFNETTFADVRGPVSLGHVFGLNWKTEGGYSVGMTIQRSDINADLGVVERTAWTLSGGYRSPRVNWVSRIEYRDDQAAFSTEDVNQWVSLNRFDLRLSEDFRLLTRLNYAETEDNASVLDNAKLVEGGIGLAYRPVDHNRINWLAKYTYLYDLTSAGQVDQFNQTRTLTDQRSHIGSIEGVRRFGPRWSLGGKLARRVSELRLSRDNGDWFESTTDFAAIRVRYHVIRNWDALAEYRFLRVDEAESERRGWLLGVDRHVGKHMKIGVGYNFTDFSDDLTQLDYEFDGFFLNVLGKY
ncbi:MAG: OmpA family protein [Pseudomonadota bacterium]